MGPRIPSLTLPYDPADVSTVPADGNMDQMDPNRMRLNVADLFSNCTTPSSGEMGYHQLPCERTQPAGAAVASSCQASIDQYQSELDYKRKHCYPQLMYHSDLHSADPSWSNCQDYLQAANFRIIFDPPRVLTPAAGMVGDFAAGISPSRSHPPLPFPKQQNYGDADSRWQTSP